MTSSINSQNPPEFFALWKSNLPIVIQCIKSHPRLLGAIAVCSVLQSVVPMVSFLCGIVNMCALVFIEYTIFQAIWSNITEGAPRYSISNDAVQWRMVLTALLVNLLTFALALCFLLPGIWFGIKSSLAIMMVCLEQRDPKDAISRSHELTKGNFFRTFWFRSIAPVCLMLPFVVVFITISIILGMVFRDNSSMILTPFRIVFILGIYFVSFTAAPPLVHLYAYLNQQKSSTSADDLSGVRQARQ